MEDLYVNPRLTIPADQLHVSYSRSGGPGGQNVNKVSTKATLRWQVQQQPLLAADWKHRLCAQHGNRINREGEIILHSDRYRDQPRNLTDCRARLVEILLNCAKPPLIRKATAPSKASRQRRIDAKRRNADKKSGRRSPGFE